MLASRDHVKLIPVLPTGSPATGVLTSNNTNVSDADTVTIGTKVYRFKNTIAQINDVFIGANADASLTNLANAINGTGTAGTDYFTGTVKNTAVTSSAVASHAITVTSVDLTSAANLIATTKSAATLTWGDTTLDGASGGPTLNTTLDAAATYNSEIMDVGTLIEMIAFLNIYSHAGTNPTLDIKLQYSSDKLLFVDSGDAFTQVTTVNSTTFKKITANFGRYVRFVVTVGGTLPHYNFDLILRGKA